MTISQIAEIENNLLRRVTESAGTIEEKVSQLSDEGIYEAYKQVHRQYANLADVNDEALKRALFIQWYVMASPGFITGIDDVDSRAERRVIDVLDKQVGQNMIDSELHAMVSYYCSEPWEYIFERFENCDNLEKLLRHQLDYDAIIDRMRQSNLSNRGQMGVYWQSII